MAAREVLDVGLELGGIALEAGAERKRPRHLLGEEGGEAPSHP